MTRLVIVSNRLPVTIQKQGDVYVSSASSGGLATGLSALPDSIEKIWVGWPGSHFSEAEEPSVTNLLQQKNLIPVFLSENETVPAYVQSTHLNKLARMIFFICTIMIL